MTETSDMKDDLALLDAVLVEEPDWFFFHSGAQRHTWIQVHGDKTTVNPISRVLNARIERSVQRANLRLSSDAAMKRLQP